MKGQEGLSGSSPLRADGSLGCQAGRLNWVSSGQRQTRGDYWGSSPLKSDGFRVVRQERLVWVCSGQKTPKESLKLKGDYQARVYSHQMVLLTVRQGAGVREQWPKTFKEKSAYRCTHCALCPSSPCSLSGACPVGTSKPPQCKVSSSLRKRNNI